MDTLLRLVALVACIVIIARTEPALNLMCHRQTPWLLALSFFLILVAAAAAAVFILLGNTPPIPAIIGAVGVACLMVCERRIRYLARRPRHLEHS